MGAGGSIISTESEAREWAAQENVPFDALVMRRAQEVDMNFNHVKIKQIIPPRLPKWDHISLYLRGERVACQQEDGETASALSSNGDNLDIIDSSNNVIPNIGPETGCESRVFELKGTTNSIHLSKPLSLPISGSGHTIACWIKPEASLWQNAASDEKASYIKLLHHKTYGSAAIALIMNGHDFFPGICLSDQSFIVATNSRPLIADKWQLITMTCEQSDNNINKRAKKSKCHYHFYLATDDGYVQKDAGYIDVNTSIAGGGGEGVGEGEASQSPSVCQSIDCIGSGVSNIDIGYMSSVYIYDVVLQEEEIESIYMAEYWRYGIKLKSIESELMERASHIMSKLGMFYIGDKKVTTDSGVETEGVDKSTGSAVGGSDTGDDVDSPVKDTKTKPTLFSMLQNLSLWKRKSIDTNEESKEAEAESKDDTVDTSNANNTISSEWEVGLGDFSNMGLVDEELECILLILCMSHLRVINLSMNDQLTLKSLGEPLIEFISEVSE